MTNYVVCTLLAVGYILLYWMIGTIPAVRLKIDSIPALCIFGYLIYYTMLELVALPMKLLHQPLSHLSVVWGALMLFLLGFVLVRRRDVLKAGIYRIAACLDVNGNDRAVRGKKRLSILCIVLFTLLLAVWIGRNRNIISPYDAAYYIGGPVSSTYSNTLDAMNVYTGELMEASEHYYLLNTDFLHSAMIFQVLNIHSLPERLYSFTMAMVVLFEMMLFLFGQELFDKEETYGKTALFMMFATFVLMEAYSLSSVSHRFAYRTYEGKSIIAYFYLSLIFLFCYVLYRKKEEKWPWLGLFLCSTSGIAFCNTALFLVPGMIATTLLPYLFTEGILKRDIGMILRFLGVLIPCVIWIVLYAIL